MLPEGFGSFPSVFSRARWCNLVIKPMVVDLEVDATLGDEFYYYYDLGVTESYLQFFLKKL